MKVSIEWLKELTGIKAGDNEIIDGIPQNGLEVETVKETGAGKQNIVVVQIKSIEKHPDAAKLSVTTVDAGKHGIKKIITNLTMLKNGDKLLAALDGAVLSDGMSIKKTLLKGVESEGMFVGWEQLGFDYKVEEPVFVDDEMVNGTNYGDLLPFNDKIIDIEITSNRGDCLGMRGISTDISSRFGATVNDEKYDYPTAGGDVSKLFSVDVKSPNCYRYCGAVIKDIKIQRSPLWMQMRLIKAGIRPINNVVDITNYVLLEQNQPLHAFDMDKINNHKLIIRDALPGETMVTLDNVERKLDPQDIVIADDKQGHCLAGVMGGIVSEVTDNTKNVFLEAAFFKSVNIRKTSRRLALRSESSYRFEREIDRENVEKALRRALQLFTILKAGTVTEGIIDVYPVKYEQKIVKFSTEWLNNKVGTTFKTKEIADILAKIKFKTTIENDNLSVVVPSWRNDVKIKEDIAEEVARIYGYNNIVRSYIASTNAASRTDKQKKEKDVINLMLQSGLTEVFNFSYIGKALFDKMELPADHKIRDAVMLEEPLTDEWAGMRTSLIPGMIKTVSFNVTRQNKDLALFEVGNISYKSGDVLPVENKMVCIALTGMRSFNDFATSEVKFDFYDAKGIIERLFEHFNVKFEIASSNENYLHPYQQGYIFVNDNKVGVIGKIHPVIADNFNIDVDCFIAEINLTNLFETAVHKIVFQNVPKFPSSEKDIAVIVNDSVTAEDIRGAICKIKNDIIRDFHIFDIYRGDHIEKGAYSVAIRFSLNKMVSTLTDGEIDETMKMIIDVLNKELGAKLR